MTGRPGALAALVLVLALAAAGCLRRGDPEVLRQRAVIEELGRKNAELALEVQRLRAELAAERARRKDTRERAAGGAP